VAVLQGALQMFHRPNLFVSFSSVKRSFYGYYGIRGGRGGFARASRDMDCPKKKIKFEW
jgi:hypothetical protein